MVAVVVVAVVVVAVAVVVVAVVAVVAVVVVVSRRCVIVPSTSPSALPTRTAKP